ncbi:transketolase [Cokeromyces recurvatus]|uniref:transketolase n=1 Tax=Cokeromyces recurvatus TaxID=90255 RepID=UPI00221ECE36|nr:transketolase [Cokeromyces recurvatus]KAI7901320.1 transketolase [Cokeromyces recurvatus]
MDCHIDHLAINTIRCLAADVVKGANSGHPGAPMGCAPIAHVLFTKFLNFNPKNPKFINRDRFVLSNGHACALHYIMLHLSGYDLSMDDLKQFRQLGSKTPGHPEVSDTPGIEVTTGPLGQGIANAVGLAAAEAHLAATYNRPGFKLFNRHVYAIFGDGCYQEGISHEAFSLAGHWKLGQLIAIYDYNKITIDGPTDISSSEDVIQRFQSYGWHVLVVENGDEDLAAIERAIEEAKAVTDKPTLIKVNTTIGFGSLNQGKENVHGAPLSDNDIKQLKKKFGFSEEKKYIVPQEVYNLYKARAEYGAQVEAKWNALFAEYKIRFPKEGTELERRFSGQLPVGWEAALPRFTPSDPAIATRKLSEGVLTALSTVIPELLGGSADLTSSNLTRWKNAIDFQHPSTQLGDYSGRYFRYGVREHGMFAIMNGLTAFGGNIPYGGTFLNFLTYGWGAARLSALSHFRVLYVMTHDSIGLGEDGSTHQPIETLVLTRATPNMLTFRPADGNEVSGTYLVALKNQHRPSVIALSRQNLPQLEGTSVEAIQRGGYVLQDTQDLPQLILIATGSEVSLAVDAAKELNNEGIQTRVVSMPCTELFDEQSDEYKKSVLLNGVPIISIEALSVTGWEKYAHAHIGMKSFGASAPINALYETFGITVDATVAKAKKVIKYYQKMGYVPEVGLDF